MKLEWARLATQPRVPEPDNEIVLEGSAACRVLLLHGLTGTPTEFAYIAHFLHRRAGLSVECRRLANHGQPITVLAETRWEELLQSARGHLRRASERARHDRVPLVIGGLSFGAVLSLILAAESPREVGGVVGLSPTLFYDGWSVPWTQRLISVADYLPINRYFYLREQPPYGVKDEALRAKIAASYANARLGDHRDADKLGYSHFPLRLFCEMRHLIALCVRELPQVHAPLLLVQAEHDEVTSPRNSHFILRRVASERKQLVMLANSYHVITADLERAQVASSMAQFCLSLAGPARERKAPRAAGAG
jgi:carboxylesterase